MATIDLFWGSGDSHAVWPKSYILVARATTNGSHVGRHGSLRLLHFQGSRWLIENKQCRGWEVGGGACRRLTGLWLVNRGKCWDWTYRKRVGGWRGKG